MRDDVRGNDRGVRDENDVKEEDRDRGVRERT